MQTQLKGSDPSDPLNIKLMRILKSKLVLLFLLFPLSGCVGFSIEGGSTGIGVYTSISWFKLLAQIKTRQSNTRNMVEFFDGMIFQYLQA